MPVTVPRGPKPETDDGLQQIIQALDRYAADHSPSAIDIYRHGQYVIRVRVINETFRGQAITNRHHTVWGYLKDLPEEVLSDLSVLLLLTPEEKEESYASHEFDDPLPARL